MNLSKLEKILVFISLGLQIFNIFFYCANSIQLKVLDNWLVLLGLLFFIAMASGTFLALFLLKRRMFNRSGWILLIIGFVQIGSNPVFNILCLINVAAGTLLVAKNINMKVRGVK